LFLYLPSKLVSQIDPTLYAERVFSNQIQEGILNNSKINEFLNILKERENQPITFLFGNGFGSLEQRINQEQYLIDFRKGNFTTTETSFLIVFNDFGALGIVFFFVFFIYLLYRFYHIYKNKNNDYALFIIGIIFYYFISGLLIKSYTNSYIDILTALVIGVAYLQFTYYEKKSKSG